MADKKPKLLYTCTHTHTLIEMGTKTITIMDDAYGLLVRNKRKDESFSDVVRREFSKKGSILDLAGAWSDLSDKDVEDIKKNIRQFREQATKSLLKSGKK